MLDCFFLKITSRLVLNLICADVDWKVALPEVHVSSVKPYIVLTLAFLGSHANDGFLFSKLLTLLGL